MSLWSVGYFPLVSNNPKAEIATKIPAIHPVRGLPRFFPVLYTNTLNKAPNKTLGSRTAHTLSPNNPKDPDINHKKRGCLCNHTCCATHIASGFGKGSVGKSNGRSGFTPKFLATTAWYCSSHADKTSSKVIAHRRMPSAAKNKIHTAYFVANFIRSNALLTPVGIPSVDSAARILDLLAHPIDPFLTR